MAETRDDVAGVLRVARLLAAALLLGLLLHLATGCSGGERAVPPQDGAPRSSWDDMSWDDGQWALRAPFSGREIRA